MANCSITRVWAVLAFERRVKGHLWTAQGHRINDIYTLCVISMLCNSKCIKAPIGRRTTFKNNIHIFFSLNDSSSKFLHFLVQLDHFLTVSQQTHPEGIFTPPSVTLKPIAFAQILHRRQWGPSGWASLISKSTVKMTGCRTHLSITWFIFGERDPHYPDTHSPAPETEKQERVWRTAVFCFLFFFYSIFLICSFFVLHCLIFCFYLYSL